MNGGSHTWLSTQYPSALSTNKTQVWFAKVIGSAEITIFPSFYYIILVQQELNK